ncbi:MAG: ribbon-helix-helix protein, CopG family [Candidatus Methylomirabilis oxyfera]|nr:ribbon-helix-helix protein, CopG family [Candidatus Methylomirabilis oxyfera]
MPTVTDRSPKLKITVTLSPDVVTQLDALLDLSGNRSRSLLVEEALRRWFREHTRKQIEHRVEEYYRSLSKVERKEDEAWSKTSARSAKHLWDK